MKYFLIVGEASGDLHAAHLMRALQARDASAEFRYYGGDAMQQVAPGLLCHYRKLAYMGIVPVLLHLRTIWKGMRDCKKALKEFSPDALILVDYPGFNLQMAKFAHEEGIGKVFYYISPKIWAWKSHRIHAIRKYVDELYSILPFEVDYFNQRNFPITYVGNPTLDEVCLYQKEHPCCPKNEKLIALLPGSRTQEIKDNFSRMLAAVEPWMAQGYRIAVAVAPSQPLSRYQRIIDQSVISSQDVDLVQNDTFTLLSQATVACVTSGTATLETALFKVPQVVCYYIACGRIVNFLRQMFLHVPYISLVNLISGKEVVKELVAHDMSVENLRKELHSILPGGEKRERMLVDYEDLWKRMGAAGAPQRTAQHIVHVLQSQH